MRDRFESIEVPAAVAVGGAIGSLGRWYIAEALGNATFPVATLATNLIGSFVLGLVLVVGEAIGHPHRRPHRPAWVRLWRPFLATGVLGGFTTFSTFAFESTELNALRASVYLAASLGLGLLAYAAGNRLARGWFGVTA